MFLIGIIKKFFIYTEPEPDLPEDSVLRRHYITHLNSKK
jgi:hypothetical protein